MLVVFFKSVIIFFMVFIVVRIMGKRELGQMQPYELVITLIIAEVACLPMNDPSIPLYFSFIPITTLAFLEILLAYLSKKNKFIRKLTDGEAVLVFDKDGINAKKLSKLNMSASDLVEAVRASGVVDIMSVAYVIVETNGKLCVVENQDNQNSQVFLPVSIITDGKYNEDNLQKIGVEKVNILSFLKSNGITSLKQILYADIRQDGTIYLGLNSVKDISGKIEIAGGKDW